MQMHILNQKEHKRDIIYLIEISCCPQRYHSVRFCFATLKVNRADFVFTAQRRVKYC